MTVAELIVKLQGLSEQDAVVIESLTSSGFVIFDAKFNDQTGKVELLFN